MKRTDMNLHNSSDWCKNNTEEQVFTVVEEMPGISGWHE